MTSPGENGARGEVPRPLKDSLDRVAVGLGLFEAGSLPRLFEDWDAAVGEDLASHCWPLSLSGGTLVVGTDDSSYATHLRLVEQQVLQRLRDHGVREVSRMQVRVRPNRSERDR